MKVIRSCWSRIEGQTKPGGGPCNNSRKGQHTAEQRERKADTGAVDAHPIPFFTDYSQASEEQ